MSTRVFVDTNVLLYFRDASEPAKQKIAKSVFEFLWQTKTGRLSVQVLNEYFVNVTQKLSPGLSREAAWDDVDSFKSWNPIPIDLPLMRRAFEIRQAHSISWWDALIVGAALSAGCTRLLSEDLSQEVDYGGIQVVNPFTPDFDIEQLVKD